MSYTAAETYPIKILLDKELVSSLTNSHKVLPRHVQINPTNVCNLSCKWCSCSKRDKRLQMDADILIGAMEKFCDMGCRSVTITGGGEPLLHPEIEKIIDNLNCMGLKMGLVTNGRALSGVSHGALNTATWIRVSLGDGRKETKKYWDTLSAAVDDCPRVDWSFSYVLTEHPDLDLVCRMVEFANEHQFTHVRLVNDIFIADRLVRNMDYAKEELEKRGIPDNLVIYQSRSAWTRGTKHCYISLLKPVIGADNYIYPCCGTQYALKKPSFDYEKSMRMGTINDIDEIIQDQKCFDGRNCVKCYYSSYNNLLAALLAGINHREFV